jgi:hypothetical protein
MCELTSARTGSGSTVAAARTASGRSRVNEPPMIRNEPRRDTDEPHTTEQNCASFATEAGLVIYDPDTPAAWLESDAIVELEEVA